MFLLTYFLSVKGFFQGGRGEDPNIFIRNNWDFLIGVNYFKTRDLEYRWARWAPNWVPPIPESYDYSSLWVARWEVCKTFV